jgi:hypothetical protein
MIRTLQTDNAAFLALETAGAVEGRLVANQDMGAAG